MKKKTVLETIRWSSFLAGTFVIIYGRESIAFLAVVFGGAFLGISLETSRLIGKIDQSESIHKIK